MEPYMATVKSKAAEKLAKCTMLLIGAGAGMGKDSGLPDFRGNQGFWNNYPPYKDKFNFFECANPQFLETNPNLFWGFYGSRLIMYRQKKPHGGFHLLKKISQKMKDHFVTTSNVDGHFHQIFDDQHIYQVHGSIHHLQCSVCHILIQNQFKPEINYDQMSCSNMPSCPRCKNNMRPNILMFGDWEWMADRSEKQQNLYRKFKTNAESLSTKGQGQLAIIQIGCGKVVPTIRNLCEQAYYKNKNSILIRINPQQDSNDKYMNNQRYFHIKQGALDAIKDLALQGFKIQ